MGLSWSSQEYGALGVPWEHRGRRFDENLEAIRVAWSAEPVDFEGDFVRFENLVLEPAPVTAGGPPMLIGGNSDYAIRRALRLGDGWLGVATRYEDPEPLLARVHAALERDSRLGEDGFHSRSSSACRTRPGTPTTTCSGWWTRWPSLGWTNW